MAIAALTIIGVVFYWLYLIDLTIALLLGGMLVLGVGGKVIDENF